MHANLRTPILLSALLLVGIGSASSLAGCGGSSDDEETGTAGSGGGTAGKGGTAGAAGAAGKGGTGGAGAGGTAGKGGAGGGGTGGTAGKGGTGGGGTGGTAGKGGTGGGGTGGTAGKGGAGGAGAGGTAGKGGAGGAGAGGAGAGGTAGKGGAGGAGAGGAGAGGAGAGGAGAGGTAGKGGAGGAGAGGAGAGGAGAGGAGAGGAGAGGAGAGGAGAGGAGAGGDAGAAGAGGAACVPTGPEICGDGLDNDCNGSIDENGASDCVTYYADVDGDTFGVTADTICSCAPQGTYTATKGADCNDGEGTVNPDATETLNGVDDNCDGAIDEGLLAESCKQLHTLQPGLPDGSYDIDPDGAGGVAPFTAYCDMTTDGGGWTLILSTTTLGPNGLTMGPVAVGSDAYLPDIATQTLATAASQVHLRTTGDAANRSITSVAETLPIINLRNLNVLNANTTINASDSVDVPNYWTGPFAQDASLLWFNCGVAPFGGPGTYPDVYWACNNGNGLHLTGAHSRWQWQGGDTSKNEPMELYVRLSPRACIC